MKKNRSYRHGIAAVALLGGIGALGIAHAVENTPAEQANIKVVHDLYQALETRTGGGLAAFSRPDYIQNTIGPRDCVWWPDGSLRCKPPQAFDLQSVGGGGQRRAGGAPNGAQNGAPRRGGPTGETQQEMELFGFGDRVMRVSVRTSPAPNGQGKIVTWIFNMFRLQDGKLAEHWDGFSGMTPAASATAAPGTAVTNP